MIPDFETLLGIDNTSLMVAHELKSPLALIRQLSLFLENNLTDQENAKRYLRQINSVSDRALRLTTNLTKAANIKQLKLELEPINVQELCLQIKSELTRSYELYNCELALRLKQYTKHYVAVADRDLLKSILIQFCDNAVHYKNKGNIDILIKKNKDQISIGVRDYGPKLAIGVWRKLKRQEFLTPQAISSRAQSSGLGLCIAQRFAQQMGASIDVCSHQDGATFYLNLACSKQLSLL